mgnify:CR=1 FL=1
MANKKAKIKPFELVCYIVFGIIAIWGVVEICLGIAGNYVGIGSAFKKACDQFKTLFGLSFLGWGLLLLGIGVVGAVTVLCITAKTSDRDFEKAQRRAARLAKETPSPEVIDVPTEKVE